MIYARLLAVWFRKNAMRIPQDVAQSSVGISEIERSASASDIDDIAARLSEQGSEVIDFLLIDPGPVNHSTVLLDG